MGTAGLAYMIARIPERYRFEGLFTIGTVVFMIDLVLFIIFNLLIIGRFAIYPRAILTCIQHPYVLFRRILLSSLTRFHSVSSPRIYVPTLRLGRL